MKSALCSSQRLLCWTIPRCKLQPRKTLVRSAPLTKSTSLSTSFSTSSTHNEGHNAKTEQAGSVQRQNGAALHRNCLVTGGASGIGYEITKQLVLNGASNVTIASRDRQKAQRAITQIKADVNLPNAPLHFVEYDFEAATISLDDLKPRDGDGTKLNFDTLINCAGITQSQGLLSTSPSTISLILKTNLETPIELSRQLLKDYFAHGKRLSRTTGPSSSSSSSSPSSSTHHTPNSYCTINISSLLANRGGHGTSIYSTSKAALTTFTRTLTLEASAIHKKFPSLPPFRANVVVPGYIDTPMIAAFSETYKKKLEGEIPLGRFGRADEVAGAVMFLLGNEYANYCVVNLDGGLGAV